MAVGKVTKLSVEAVPLPAAGKREHLWDERLKGFGVMVTDRGVRSYIVQYRIGGRGSPTRRVTIGKHGSPWTAETARKRATELLEQVRRQDDPFDAAKAKVAADREARAKATASAVISERLAFSTFAGRYVDKYAKVHQAKSWRETEGVINRDLVPRFGTTPLTAIEDADVVELLEALGERGPSAALKGYKALRQIFAYAIDKERRHFPAGKNPMAGIKPPAKMGKRDRTLTDAELRLVWLAAGGLGWPFGPIVRLLILTGQRRDEVAGMSWVEVDKEARQWLLPGARSKNGLPNLVPLSDPAMSIVTDLPVIRAVRETGDKRPDPRLLFTTTGETPVSGFSKVKARLDASMLDLMKHEAADAGAGEDELAALSVKPWTLHDLRRTLAAGCQRLGFPVEVTEAVINHVSGTRAGIVGVYQTYRYETEKRSALDAWARHVMEAITGKSAASNVVVLERRA
ncbi:site-specific integrase [Sphingomonas sp. BK580]|uniref:tyrosine-type recombinase/integrase n=1 Tax=Sphingomonas sp. BK580 TaxID=2586972 RepID=UPI0016070737|nr:integrase arm-type DNA-binding domain-containing protein [Sphingomonas sp. BK580]MBB3692467.1 integrase [Sphingomonas sp. BK580]